MAQASVRDKLSETLARYQAEGLFTHAYVAAGRLGEVAPRHAALLSPDGRDVFDLASLTKALVTTPLVFAEIERGRLTPETTIGAWLGSRAENLVKSLQDLSVGSLLGHRSGLPAWRNFWVCELGPDSPARPRAEVRDRIVTVLNRAAPAIDPRRGQVYSDLGFILLGWALEVANGMDLSEAFEALLRTQLSWEGGSLPLQYATRLKPQKRAIPTAPCAVRERLLQGEVHDENCASLGGVTGHAGLFGTGEALVQYLVRLAATPLGRAMLAANAKARVLPVGTPPNEGLLGLRQGADPGSIVFGDGRAMGHLGFTGVAFWLVPEDQSYGVFLTNRVIGGRTRPGIAQARRAVFSLLSQLIL
jgi:CubicO group peptidase (beta-lactamase class C family)